LAHLKPRDHKSDNQSRNNHNRFYNEECGSVGHSDRVAACLCRNHGIAAFPFSIFRKVFSMAKPSLNVIRAQVLASGQLLSDLGRHEAFIL